MLQDPRFVGHPIDARRVSVQGKVFHLLERSAWRRMWRAQRSADGSSQQPPAAGVVTLDGVSFVLIEEERPPLNEAGLLASERLTARELQVAQRVAHGECDKIIAYRLGISEYTVREHLRRIFSKLKVAKRTALVSFLHRHQMME